MEKIYETAFCGNIYLEYDADMNVVLVRQLQVNRFN